MTTLTWPLRFSRTTAPELKATAQSTQVYVTLPVAISSIQEATQKVLDDFVALVRDISSVEQVRGQAAGTYLHLVVYVSESTREDRFRVYEAEKAIHDRHSSFNFEFDLIDRRGYPMQTADIQGKYMEIIRKLPDTHDASDY